MRARSGGAVGWQGWVPDIPVDLGDQSNQALLRVLVRMPSHTVKRALMRGPSRHPEHARDGERVRELGAGGMEGGLSGGIFSVRSAELFDYRRARTP